MKCYPPLSSVRYYSLQYSLFSESFGEIKRMEKPAVAADRIAPAVKKEISIKNSEITIENRS